MLNHGGLIQSWAYFVPKPLLGVSCPSVLSEENRRLLLRLLERPLSQDQVITMAPDFAAVASDFVDKLLGGQLSGSAEHAGMSGTKRVMRCRQDGAQSLDTRVEELSVNPDLLKEFTLDLMNGPILNLNMWRENEIEHSQPNTESDATQSLMQLPNKMETKKTVIIGKCY